MSSLGVDFGFGRPDPTVVRAHGYDHLLRYLANPGNPKAIDREEAMRARAAGLSVVFVFETTATRALGGRPAGRADGATAARALAAIGAPDLVACYFAVDFDARTDELAKVAAYLEGARLTAGRRVGVYGSYRVVDTMLRDGHATFGWQTAAWSHHQRTARAAVYQRLGYVTVDGVTCDVDEILRADVGAWRPTVPAPPPHPAPTPPPATGGPSPVNVPSFIAPKGSPEADLVMVLKVDYPDALLGYGVAVVDPATPPAIADGSILLTHQFDNFHPANESTLERIAGDNRDATLHEFVQRLGL